MAGPQRTTHIERKAKLTAQLRAIFDSDRQILEPVNRNGLVNSRVLIIEDHRRTVGELHDRLVREGYETEVALSGEMGLAIVREREMNAAVLDHQVGGFEEWELLRRLRKRAPGLPILVINGPRRKGISRVARQAGATRFMRAPANLDRVVSIIADVLERTAVIA